MITRIHLLTYFVREALLNVTRNKMPNSIAIGMIAVSLAIFGIFLLVYGNLNAVVRRWSESVQIIAYLDETHSAEQDLELDAKIRAIPYVEDVVYVSKDAALAEFRQRLTGHEYLIEGLESNPLPASYEIRLTPDHRDLASVQSVVEALQPLSPFEDIQYGQTWIENLTTMVNMLKFIGVFLGGFLFLTVIFIISNTIKLTLYNREEELNIMRFVGATETFIKGPFLAEGIIRGFLGATVSLLILYLLYQLFMTIIHYSSPSLLAFSALSFLSWTTALVIMVLGSFLGWCGSLLTLHKFLKTY
ncbi:FtsX-like permease family protein [candidate division KSB3 bacterium]|uniref:Cell division protein FtsX n=1 Tax=candidate division KSB3 bacterium TaxID=2044937 RepID=A0A9D5Q5V6_9BACT|nr:FtsX-like permease family protein [candidate division KSB3 bacterium]MBD3325035.1 FtsX-like permease family protein [candidate division KSB3 bacterium]